MAVTLKDVAARAGVSRSAVSRTFTAGASVSDATRRRVEEAARALGYAPSALASALTTGRTQLIGLVSNNFHNPIFLEVFDLFTRGLQERGLRPLLVNLSDETDPEASVRMLRQYSVDGVIVASSTLPPSFAKAFRDAGLPVVHSFGRASDQPPVDVVGIDNVECGRIAARAFLARGMTRVAFLGGPVEATSTQDRGSGFVTELAGAPGVAVTTSYAAAYSFDAGRAEMQRLLSHGPPAQGYFCGDDVLAIGALSAVREARLDVPGDVSLIALNDMEMARWEGIGLATIRQPLDAMIERSIETMVATIEDPARVPRAVTFPCELVERGTLKPLG
ncbi:LacI family DNA-binding transcriptional regulator [Pseudaestuariivita atlantica]|uniref:Transcriptional regulator n=1 Tax=Pseudaestuariivita atlantica TaxID=1317121 RepID=A0A0L1JL19_9RHOB|nr:LacI family DNA-binding transcriptional regulator [Pseudaestuariivita atlantica]KNG92439.1 transcriptional regulator [Pseudaestuariivita atlantica]